MAVDNNFIDELKMTVNIVDVIGREVSLKKAGSTYKGLCPFHSEKTASFNVNEEKQFYKCFGCQASGDVISFVQNYYKIPFMDSVEKLCEEYGISMPEKISSGPKIDYDKFYDINAKAARFYFNNLTSGKNAGYTYFKNRGLKDEIIKKFGLGFAPNSWTSLYDYLKKEGVSDEDMLKLGLVIKGKKGLYDKFRNRVMFPIINTQGKVIGFGGRVLDDSKPKYLNSDESDIFLKKNNLYGLNLSRSAINSDDRIIMVEGYMDVISLYQAGVENVAASLGTALTDNQAKLISRYTKNVVLSYDSDNAGISAAIRGIDVIRKAGGYVKVVRIENAKDPDEFVKKFGKDAFYKLCDDAIYATDFKLQLLKKGISFNSNYDVLNYIRKCVPVLKELGPVEQDLYIKKLADEFNISEHSIAGELRSDKSSQGVKPAIRPTVNRGMKDDFSPGRYERYELSFLILSMFNTRYLKRFDEDAVSFDSDLGRKIWIIEKSFDNGIENGLHRIEAKDIYRQLEPEDEGKFRHYVDITRLGADDEYFYKQCLNGYRVQKYKDKRIQIQNELSVAEQIGDTSQMDKCLNELMNLNKLISELTEGKNV
ncbi:MAG: DNA primase [Mogibacterium sp.]|nr:DNA primase [Mogibacterium sp.]